MSMCSSFAVHNVDVNDSPLATCFNSEVETAVSRELGIPVACFSPDADVRLVGVFDAPNLLVTSVYKAFYKHYPLKLNPNVIWLTIVQGFGNYVNRHSDALRSKFVSHQGKKTLRVDRADFRYRSPSNDWPSVFPEFARFIGGETHEGIRELLECHFSNTTATDIVCSHIALMDVCQQYFEYAMGCGCGFPRIDLLGTAGDWRLVRSQAEGLRRFVVETPSGKGVGHLSVWLDALLPALDHFVLAAEGHPNLAFWGSVCNLAGVSGRPGDPITGWIGVLFPYLVKGSCFEENGGLGVWVDAFRKAEVFGVEEVLSAGKDPWHSGGDRECHCISGGIRLECFPTGLSNAPVCIRWHDVGKTQTVRFYGGMFVMHQHSDRALEVRTGWAVVEPRAKPKVKKPAHTHADDSDEGCAEMDNDCCSVF
jgi:hypothetical protein